MTDKGKVKRELKLRLRQLFISVLAVIVALGLCMIMIAAMDVDPVMAMKLLFSGALGNKNAVAETLVKMCPLIFTGLSYALAAKCGLTNIGMEGQLYIGALCATVAGVYIKGIPTPLHILLTMTAAFLGAGLWGALAGFLKVKTGASEIITTVMLNTIATNLVAYMCSGPMCEPPGLNAQSYPLEESARLPIILTGTRAHLGILIGILFAFLFYIFLMKSKKGYEVRVSGMNYRAAVYSGVSTKKNIILIMLLAGGLAGLGGGLEIMGIQGRLVANVSPGYGFDGIAVALIGANQSVGILFGAFLFGILRAGGNSLQMMAGVPTAIIKVMQAVVILVIVAFNIFNDMDFQRIFRKKKTNMISEKGE